MKTKTKSLKLEQVNAALRKYISLDKITFIYAGDFKTPGGEEKRF
jgi:zinc protease